MKILRGKEVKWPARGHAASKWQSQYSNTGSLTRKLVRRNQRISKAGEPWIRRGGHKDWGQNIPGRKRGLEEHWQRPLSNGVIRGYHFSVAEGQSARRKGGEDEAGAEAGLSPPCCARAVLPEEQGPPIGSLVVTWCKGSGVKSC